MRERPLIAVSGGFDPVHIGHVKNDQDASRYGDVLVIINSDDWLKEKKAMSLCLGKKEQKSWETLKELQS